MSFEKTMMSKEWFQLCNGIFLRKQDVYTYTYAMLLPLWIAHLETTPEHLQIFQNQVTASLLLHQLHIQQVRHHQHSSDESNR